VTWLWMVCTPDPCVKVRTLLANLGLISYHSRLDSLNYLVDRFEEDIALILSRKIYLFFDEDRQLALANSILSHVRKSDLKTMTLHDNL